MATEIRTSQMDGLITEHTELRSIAARIAGPEEDGIGAWLRTAGGIAAFLVALQFVTGILLAFIYVPSAESAWTTVAFIEQSVGVGALVRSLHYHSSVLLPIALLVHLVQMTVRGVGDAARPAWIAAVALLGLALAAAATGYALPWDARSLNGVNIAVSLAGNVPLAGDLLAGWLRNGETISTMTLSRFYGLHVFVTPVLIAVVAIGRIFVFGRPQRHDDRWPTAQIARSSIAIGLVFLGLALFSTRFPAPLAPAASPDTSSFLPRPGPQFLWLFELQKFTDGALAAVIAFGLPALIFGGLVAAVFVAKQVAARRALSIAVLAAGILIAGGLTVAACYADLSDPRIVAQLAKQDADEEAFRRSEFKPRTVPAAAERTSTAPAAPPDTPVASAAAVPSAYTASCSKCHGPAGEGKGAFPELRGLTTREEERRTDEDLLGIMNNPKSFGLSAKMPSYEHKLDESQKQEIIAWLKRLN